MISSRPISIACGRASSAGAEVDASRAEATALRLVDDDDCGGSGAEGAARGTGTRRIVIVRRSSAPWPLCAATTTVAAGGGTDGAVYRPADVIEPESAVHVTVGETSSTTAENLTLVPAMMLAGAPSIATDGVGATIALPS